MIERLYETEDVLQALLAEHPEVLAGDDEGGEHEGWLLIRREAGVADAMDSSRNASRISASMCENSASGPGQNRSSSDRN